MPKVTITHTTYSYPKWLPNWLPSWIQLLFAAKKVQKEVTHAEEGQQT